METQQNGTTKALVQQPPAATATVEVNQAGGIVRVGFDTLQGFEALQRVGKMFAASKIVPDTYAGNVADCVIAVEMAARMGASPLMVMQNLFLIHGRPSWSSQFLIAAFNSCGRFGPVRYKWTGQKGTMSWGCIAYSHDKATGELLEGPEVTLGMAKAEGWLDKKGSKWLTLPGLMLPYRAASFFIRTTAPDLTMGLRTVEESEDIGPEVAAFDALPKAGVAGLKEIAAARAAPALDVPSQAPAVQAEPVKVEVAPEPVAPATPAPAAEAKPAAPAEEPGPFELLEQIRAAKTAPDLEALSKQVQALPEGNERAALTKAIAEAWPPILAQRGAETAGRTRK